MCANQEANVICWMDELRTGLLLGILEGPNSSLQRSPRPDNNPTVTSTSPGLAGLRETSSQKHCLVEGDPILHPGPCCSTRYHSNLCSVLQRTEFSRASRNTIMVGRQPWGEETVSSQRHLLLNVHVPGGDRCSQTTSFSPFLPISLAFLISYTTPGSS